MKIKTSELIGPALDWAVAKCEGKKIELFTNPAQVMVGNIIHCGIYWFNPSKNWAQGGPIIEREKIKVDPRGDKWECTIWNESYTCNPTYGPTPLIAAMRCFVSSKMGDEIEIPEELL